MKNKGVIALVAVIVSLFFTVCIVSFVSYSFYNANTNISNNLVVSFSTNNVLVSTVTITPSNDLVVTPIPENSYASLNGSVMASAVGNISVQINAYQAISCTYDLVWEWDETSVETNRYYKTTGAVNELVLSATKDSVNLSTQLNDYQSPTTIGSSSLTCSAGTVTETWNYSLDFYNLNINQDAHEGAVYHGHITFDNFSCTSQT